MRRHAGLLKLGAAAAILAVLVGTGRLSPLPMAALMDHPATLAALLALQVAILMVGVFRWWLILGAVEGRRQRYAALLAFNWIGQFFGTVAPSSVATDATRFAYVVSSGMASRSGAVTSLVIDRTTGIVGTTLLALAMSRALAIEWLRLPSPPAIAAGVVIFVALLWIFRHRLGAVQGALAMMGRARRVSLAGIALAMAAMLLKVVSVWLIVRVASIGDAGIAFVAAPVGFLAEAIPITPGGLGTAHLAFELLFAQRGLEGGATFFSIYFLVRLAASLVGGIIWAARRGAVRASSRQPDASAARAEWDSLPDHRALRSAH